MGRARAPLLAASFLLLPLFCFWPVVAGSRTLIATDWLGASPLWSATPRPGSNPWMSDTVESYYPSEKLYSESVRRGEIPLTNPLLFGGAPIPHGAHLWNSVWPPKLLFLLCFDPVRSYDLYALFHWALAGAAMFGFLRSRGRGDGASFVAALAYALSGRAMTWLHGHYLMPTLACLPLVFWAVGRRSLWGIAPLAGLFFTNPQIGIFAALAAVVLERWSWRLAVPAVLLAGPALAPLAAAVSGSLRDPLSEARWFTRDGFGLWRLLAELFRPGSVEASLPPNEFAPYLGIVPLAGAAFGASRERRFAALAGIALAVAVLYPLPLWLSPLTFSLPTRLLCFFALGGAVCFAAVLDRRPIALLVVAGLLVLVDLLPRFLAYNAPHDPAPLRETPPAVAALSGTTGVHFQPRGRPFFPPLSLFGVRSIHGYDALVPRAQAEALAGAARPSGQRLLTLTDPEHPALDAAGMRFLLTDRSYDSRRHRLVHESGAVRVWENPAAREVPPRRAASWPGWAGAGLALAGAALTLFLARRYSGLPCSAPPQPSPS
jgi:hypothetical protein